MEKKAIARPTLYRFPVYLNYLKGLDAETVSSRTVAQALGYGEVQVRKDLASVCDAGKPRVGYPVPALVDALEGYLGFRSLDCAVLVGAGRLGRALLEYEGFGEYGMQIAAAFDKEPAAQGILDNGKRVFPLERLEELTGRLQARIGILAVPASAAQETADRMIASGIRGILNFAPAHIIVPEDVLVQNENIATSLALLAKRLSEKM